MNDRTKQIYFAAICAFFAILIISYFNIASGGAILWLGPNLFYLCMALVSISLTYMIFNSKNDSLDMETYAVFFLCISLSLLHVISESKIPSGLDSIISMQSIPFILNNGYSLALSQHPDLLIKATYSHPMLSILGAILMLVLDVSYITIAKYLPFILTLTSFLIYYTFISKILNKKVALLSMSLISTFLLILGNIASFVNASLAMVLVLLSWWFLYWRFFLNGSSKIIFLQIFVLLTFILTHHLTIFIFLISVFFFFLFYILGNNANTGLKQKISAPIIILSVILSMSAVFVLYPNIFSIIVNTLTNKLPINVIPVSSPSVWATKIMIQRITYAIFVMFFTFYAVLKIKTGLRDFLSEKYTTFLLLGYVLFLSSFLSVVVHAPFNWDRIAIFGWLFFIPGSIYLLLEQNLENHKLTQYFAIVVICLLFLGNIYAIPERILDHSGDKEYEGGFKSWVKVQEWNSVLWIIKDDNTDKIVMGDEPVRRIYLTNSPNYKGNFKFIPETFREIKNSDFTYIVIRNENFHQVVGGFYVAKGQKWQKYAIEKYTYEKILSDCDINSVYDNKEVNVLYRTEY